MRKLKHEISVYIKDDLDILDCKHKKALVLGNLLDMQNCLNENYNLSSYFVKNDRRVNNISVVKNVKEFDSLNILTLKTDFSKLLSIKLKDRKQIERKHFLIVFSREEERLSVNENNYSYFYNINNLLTGSFKESLLNIIMEKTK